ncbi:helix-turn-helix domain-containing protein [Microbacterium nymphoidis]|uniref:helix-turn-helix domain-containing protein n=1 Tax=Microbacterium nymphoidis TaxID=2898586 RepID=UPI00355704DD
MPGLRQRQLAERFGVTPRYLAVLERGERSLTLDVFDEYTKIFGQDTRSRLRGELCRELW